MWPFESESLKPVLLAAISLAAGLLLFRVQLRRGRKRAAHPDEPPAGRPRPSRLLPGKSYDDLQVEMHELSREILGKIDSKLALLEALIRDAKAESERLEELLRRAGTREEPADQEQGGDK